MRRTLPLGLPVACAVTTCAMALLLAACSAADQSRAVPAPETRGVATTTSETRAVARLHSWDRRRAEAYASGSEDLLRRLYVPGSAAGRDDVRRLRAYAARGLVVRDLTMQLLAVRVLRASPSVIRLRVTDRVASANVRGPDGELALPRDLADTRVLTLTRDGGSWRMRSVTEVGRSPRSAR